jgi:hypothetical protein
MTINVHATYRDGLIHPAVPLNLPDSTPVEVTVVASDNGKDAMPTGDASQALSPRFTRDQLRERIAKYGVSVGTLPVDFSRADIYSDHD